MLSTARTHAQALFGAALGLAAAGCSTAVVDDSAEATAEHSQGVVIVESVTAADGSKQAHVSAKFMRLVGGADQEVAERLVGSRLDLPALGECRDLGEKYPADTSLSMQGAIELLDVGDVTMSSTSAAMPLAARAFPDIADFVSGVFYTSRDASAELAAPARYRVQGSGSSAVAGFAFDLDSPAPLDEVRLQDEPLGVGTHVEAGSPLTLRWLSGEAQDVIYVDFSAARSSTALRCAFSDSGEGVVPAGALSEAFATPAVVSIAVHRVRLMGLDVPALDSAEARFDLSVLGRVYIDPPAQP